MEPTRALTCIAFARTALRSVRAWLDAKEAEFAHRQDLLAATAGAQPATDALANGRKMSRRAAERAADRAATLGETPAMDTQLAKGNISGEHVDALAVAAKRLDDDQRAGLFDLHEDLALAAASKTPEQFGRHVRKTIEQLCADDGIERSEHQRAQARLTLGVNDATGMGEIRGEINKLQQQLTRSANLEALRRELRERRMRESKEKQRKTKEQREVDRKARAEAWKKVTAGP